MYKPLPYTLLRDGYPSRQFAQWLRGTFAPLLKRRMPSVFYAGFSHRFIPDFITRYKKDYPYYIRADFSKFYPSIRHKELIVATQLAYKGLISSSYVPRSFKQEFLPQAQAFLSTLPLDGVGLPLNSGVSKAWAPLIYIPLLLDISRRYDVRYIAFVDDLFFLCKDSHTATQVYTTLHNEARKLGLQLHPHKVNSGRMGSEAVDFCGWRFAGGYISICEEKVERFRTRIGDILRKYQAKPLHLLIKKLNDQILGFGHYYKYGQVKRLYEALDIYISKMVYQQYLRHRVRVVNGAYKRYLRQCGLKSLLELLPSIARKPKKASSIVPQPRAKNHPMHTEESLMSITYLEKLVEQQKQILGLLKDIRRVAIGFERY